MNNFEVTQQVIFEKLVKSAEKKMDMQPSDTASELDKAYYYLNKIIELQNITSVRPVVSSRHGFAAKFVIIIKKIIRKLLFWYIEPICRQQTQYNEMCVQYCAKMFYHMQKSEADVNSQIIEKLNLLEEDLVRRDEKISAEMLKIQQNMKEKNDEIFNEIQETQKNLDKFEYMSGEFPSVINDMQTIRRESGLLFENSGVDEEFWNKVTVAQAGEDSIIEYVFMVLGIKLEKEYYLDLGANHAKQLSNTYTLYKKGMRGVLVEANPELIGELKFFRSEDIILNKCIADKTGEAVKFYIMSGDGLSCNSLETIKEMQEKNPQIYVKEEVMVETITVNEILEKYFAKAPLLLSIDIEGQEENILRAIDYERYAPFVIIVERIEYGTTIATQKREDGIEKIMQEKGYFEYAFTGINSIFINKKMLEEIRNENSI